MTDEFAQAHDDYHASKVIVQTPPQPAMAMPSETDTPAPTAPEATEKQLLLDPKFAAAAREVYMLFEGEPFDGDDKMAARYGIDAIGEFNYNFAGGTYMPNATGAPGTIQAAALLTSGTQDQARAFVYLMDRYDQLPNFTLDGTVRMLRGLIADPSVYTGFGTLGAGFVARKTGAVGIKKLLAEIAKRPGTSAAVYTGIEAGAADQLTQGIEKQAGYEIDPVTGAIRTGVSAVVGGLAGGGTIKAGEAIARELAPAVQRGLTQLGEGAEARMAERGPMTDRLMSGGDPMDVIDPALAAGKLINKVDEARTAYEASPNDPSLRKEYLTARHERDAQLSSMPPKEKFEIDTDYRMAHQPPSPQDGAARLDDMTGGGTVFPDDIYSENALRFYGGNNPADQESLNVIQSVKGDPDAEIIIYRAVPKNANNINPGDWVTLSKRYAEDHAESGYGPDGNQAGKVVSQKVKVKDIYSGGNDLNEFGYFPEDIAKINVAKIEPPTETEPGIIAFHGSGADFDEFKLEKVGTGVGHQAYGSGFYFSSSKELAKDYKGSAGKLFMVKLGVKEEDLLDWQQPLKQQPKILKKIRALIDDKDILKSFDYNVDKGIMGGNAYSNYIGKTKEETSKILKSVGINGIKYFDIGSKGGGKTLADAPTNYVIFDDKAIKILEKYGIVGPVAVTALGATKQSNSEKDTQNEAM